MDLISKVGKNNPCVKKHKIKLKKHNIQKRILSMFISHWRVESRLPKEDFLCVIHDKMDHSKTPLPQFPMKNKMVFKLGQLPMTLIRMIVHGHGDEIFTQYSNEFWPNDLNFTNGSLLCLFRSLENEQVRELGVLFEFEP
jgi:hypothetical protein